LGFLRLTKSGQASTHTDRVLAELAHERFCRPRPTAVSGPLDSLRQAFVDRTLEVSLHATSKAALGAAFAKVTLSRPPDPDAKARKAIADKRKAADATSAAAHAPLATKHAYATWAPQKNDGVARRADSCFPTSPFMRHRVR
jgi:hypothetical protein